MAAKPIGIVPIVSKIYCSTSEIVFGVRRRPHVVNGGGFVVVDLSQKVVFRVDGCGVLGKKEELILRDGDGGELLLIRRKVIKSIVLLQFCHDSHHSKVIIF